MLEEDDSEIIQNIENNFIKLNNNLVDSISFTVFNDDASTYMGVKSVAEEQSTITNESKKQKSKKIQNKKIKKIKNKKRRKEESFSSVSESKSSDEESKEKTSGEDLNNKRNSLTELLKQKEKNNDKKKEKFEDKNNKKNIENSKKIKRIKEIETKFEYEGSGKLVYVTGSFCDWKKFYIMTKNNEGIFSLTLTLPRGFHQYKFKVDDNWAYSKIQPKYEDNGNVNNFIDTTDYDCLSEEESENENELEKKDNNDSIKNNYDINDDNNSKENIKSNKFKKNNKQKQKGNKSNKKEKISKEKKPKEKKSEEKKVKKIKKRNSSILSVNFLNSQNYFTIYYPLRSEFNKKPLSLPGLYKTCFILNEDYKQKEERRFSEVEYINNSGKNSSSISSSERSSLSIQSSNSKIPIFGEIIPYVKFQNLYHIHSNHLHSKMFYNYISTSINSMTSRYRFKFSTFIYYKPNKPVEQIRRIKHSKTVKILFKK